MLSPWDGVSPSPQTGDPRARLPLPHRRHRAVGMRRRWVPSECQRKPRMRKQYGCPTQSRIRTVAGKTRSGPHPRATQPGHHNPRVGSSSPSSGIGESPAKAGFLLSLGPTRGANRAGWQTKWQLECGKCHAAIQRDDREELLGRVMLAPVSRTLPDRYAPRFRQRARELHERFWQTRSGPPALA
jgi:hypothetical protein